jgi:hypothetical protein
MIEIITILYVLAKLKGLYKNITDYDYKGH